jgi:hypothetical protein
VSIKDSQNICFMGNISYQIPLTSKKDPLILISYLINFNAFFKLIIISSVLIDSIGIGLIQLRIRTIAEPLSMRH